MVTGKNIFILKNENMNFWKKIEKTVFSKICIYLVKNESQYNMKIFKKLIFYNMALTKTLKYLLLVTGIFTSMLPSASYPRIGYLEELGGS